MLDCWGHEGTLRMNFTKTGMLFSDSHTHRTEPSNNIDTRVSLPMQIILNKFRARSSHITNKLSFTLLVIKLQFNPPPPRRGSSAC